MSSIFKNKKGTSVDNFWVLVSFFLLCIFFLTMSLFWNSLKDVSGLWDSDPYGSQMNDDTQQFINRFDFILVAAYFGLHLGVLALAFFLRSHPVVYVAAILLMAILAIVAAPISNAYSEIIGDSQISTVSSSIPITNYIMENFPKFEVIWAILTAVLMFGLARYEGFI